jgi:hypothetical protein
MSLLAARFGNGLDSSLTRSAISSFSGHDAGYRGSSDSAEVGCLHHDGHAGGQLDLVGALIYDHALQSQDVIENRFDITENDTRLFFIPSQTHNRQGLAHRNEWLEVDEAGNETGYQRRDE